MYNCHDEFINSILNSTFSLVNRIDIYYQQLQETHISQSTKLHTMVPYTISSPIDDGSQMQASDNSNLFY